MDEPAVEVPVRREPFFKLPRAIWLLLAIMVAVHVYVNFQSAPEQLRIVSEFGFVPSNYSGPGTLHLQGVPLSMWFPFITHLFLHGNFAHIAFNGLWLMAVGTPLARRLGTLPFLGFYLVCGVLSALSHLLGNLGSYSPVIGASGAIAGCMAGAIRVMYSPDARYFSIRDLRLGSLAPLWDMRIILVTIVWMIINLLMGSGLVPIPGAEGASIAWEAHVGGFLAGLVLLPLFDHLAGRGAPVFPRRSA
jgi:membrane associated rhomboid family serine protease